MAAKCISRKKGQSINIGPNITVKIGDNSRPNRVLLVVSAPDDVPITRDGEEIPKLPPLDWRTIATAIRLAMDSPILNQEDVERFEVQLDAVKARMPKKLAAKS